MYPWDEWYPGYCLNRATEGRLPPGRRWPVPTVRTRNAFAPDAAGTIEIGKGTLRFRVLADATDERIAGASIRVQGEGGLQGTKEYYNVLTDAYGFSPKMSLPTPAQKYSQQAGGVVTPYFTYTITIGKPGYHTQVYRGIQIFADTECMHDAKLKPLQNGAKNKPEVVYTEPPHMLAK
ncbi:MAG: carboxypeptidase-like regulatory domain-containing protein [Eubacteriales bacterium]